MALPILAELAVKEKFPEILNTGREFLLPTIEHFFQAVHPEL